MRLSCSRGHQTDEPIIKGKIFENMMQGDPGYRKFTYAVNINPHTIACCKVTLVMES